MSAKFDDRGYCVVQSKADDGVDWQTTAQNQKRLKDIKMVADLGKKISGEASAVKNFQGQIRKLTKSLKSRNISPEERTKLQEQWAKLQEKKRNHQKLERDLKRQKTETKWAQVYKAVQSRSNILADEINRYLKGRYAVFMKNCPGLEASYCPPRIFPVSVRAYWPLQPKIEDDFDVMPEDHMVGFPEEAYTGIPVLKSWLYEA